MSEATEHTPQAPMPGVLEGNLKEPIRLTGIELNGISAEASNKGGTVRIWTRLFMTSEERLFHRIVKSLASHIELRASQAGHPVSIEKTGFTLLVIHPDNTADLWADAAAVVIQAQMKRPVQAGAVVFEADITDIIAMSFPLVPIETGDRVVCIFREGWRFALFLDCNPEGHLSVADMERDLGTLSRRLKYTEIYEAIENDDLFKGLIDSGWFPFAEIMGAEFVQLSMRSEAKLDLDDVEAALTSKFDSARLEQMFARWMTKPHFAGKEKLLRSALTGFSNGDPVHVLKIALTEIEGILNDAYRKRHGKGAKLKKLLEFAILSAEEKTGQPHSLMFPTAFARYLREYTFADFDPAARNGKAGSRHAVGHGAAESDSYTLARALQALLTVDQLAFYT
ncbi:hypothetical protein [Phyllobacterium ifriqiyense]|uniref:hypothetical protein n=1 Tax=Phyllobacterium ifriqiyense TaxID=314238 RepID=UPI0033995E2E